MIYISGTLKGCYILALPENGGESYEQVVDPQIELCIEACKKSNPYRPEELEVIGMRVEEGTHPDEDFTDVQYLCAVFGEHLK